MKSEFIVTVAILALTLCFAGPRPGAAQSAEDLFAAHVYGSNVQACALQADGKILVGGNFTNIAGETRSYFGRVLPDGRCDPTFNCVFNGYVCAIAVQTNGGILVGGDFDTLYGASRPHIARVLANGMGDATFTISPNLQVRCLAVQPDGKILMGGDFTAIDGASHERLARLNEDGTVDSTFTPPSFSDRVRCLALQPDGRILVGGSFVAVNGNPSLTCIARLLRDGSVDSSFNPTEALDSYVYGLAVQPDGKIVLGGRFSSVGGTVQRGLARLNADGSRDTSFNTMAGGTHPFLNAVAVQPDGKIVVGGSFIEMGSLARSRIARLNADGSMDTGFDPAGGADGTVNALAVQPDGKLLIGGDFLTVGGYTRRRLARFYPADGSCESTFKAGDPDNLVSALAVQPDGKVIVGGSFASFDGAAHPFVARATTSRAFYDATFAAVPNGNVRCAVVQPDGKVVLGGEFTTMNGAEIHYVARVNADGSTDNSFSPQPDAPVRGLTLLPDGSLLVCGEFTAIGATTYHNIAKVSSNGVVDTSFYPNPNGIVYGAIMQPDHNLIIYGEFTQVGSFTRNHVARIFASGSSDSSFDPGNGASDTVNAAALQPDGKILLGGYFFLVDDVEHHGIARLNSNGSLDTAFNADTDGVLALGIQADGKIIVGGMFIEANGVPRLRIARLMADGTLDTSFDPPNGASNTVYGVAIQWDGKPLAGGSFLGIGGYARSCLGRLSTSNAALQELRRDNYELIWTRAGSSPEIQWARFQYSLDRSAWVDLASPARVGSDWSAYFYPGQLPLNTNFYVRALGYAAGGRNNGSGSLCESVRMLYLTTPAILITNVVAHHVTNAYASTTFILQGSNNANVAGTMIWGDITGDVMGSNGFGEFPAAPFWQCTVTNLVFGTNMIIVVGSNALGEITYDGAYIIARRQANLGADFDGDGFADPATMAGVNIYEWPSASGYARSGPYAYSTSNCLPCAGDVDGDTHADTLIYCNNPGLLYVCFSSVPSLVFGPIDFGMPGTAPLVADFDGDNLADFGLYAADACSWYVWLSTIDYSMRLGPFAFGLPGAVPVAADFDGDRLADPGAYVNGSWFRWLSGSGYVMEGPYAFGDAGGLPVAADFDRDGLADLAVTYDTTWYVRLSTINYTELGPFSFAP